MVERPEAASRPSLSVQSPARRMTRLKRPGPSPPVAATAKACHSLPSRLTRTYSPSDRFPGRARTTTSSVTPSTSHGEALDAEPRMHHERHEHDEQQHGRGTGDVGDDRRARRSGGSDRRDLTQHERHQDRQRGPPAVSMDELEAVVVRVPDGVARRPHHRDEDRQHHEPDRSVPHRSPLAAATPMATTNHAVPAIAVARCNCPRWYVS